MSKTNKGFSFFIEILWLIFGVTALILGIINNNNHGFEKSKMIFLVSVISFGMYFLRRYMRKLRNSKNNK